MNSLEKRVWAVAYAMYWKDGMGGLDEDEEIRHTTTAVEWADNAVLYLRDHQKANEGRFHVNEDLELERLAEEG